MLRYVAETFSNHVQGLGGTAKIINRFIVDLSNQTLKNTAEGYLVFPHHHIIENRKPKQDAIRSAMRKIAKHRPNSCISFGRKSSCIFLSLKPRNLLEPASSLRPTIRHGRPAVERLRAHVVEAHTVDGTTIAPMLAM